jgi:hypothetical protein
MKLFRRIFQHRAAGAAVLTVLVALADHGAWSQAARTIKIIVPAEVGGRARRIIGGTGRRRRR